MEGCRGLVGVSYSLFLESVMLLMASGQEYYISDWKYPQKYSRTTRI